jgi:large subunit ribosomal protein L28
LSGSTLLTLEFPTFEFSTINASPHDRFLAHQSSARPTGPAGTIDADPASHMKECTVAANCDVCGKGPSFGHSISHSHRRTKRRWNPNIQRVRTLVGKTPKRQNVCASCLKAGKVVRN